MAKKLFWVTIAGEDTTEHHFVKAKSGGSAVCKLRNNEYAVDMDMDEAIYIHANEVEFEDDGVGMISLKV